MNFHRRHRQKGTLVNHTEHSAKTPSRRNGLLARFASLLGTEGSGAPSRRPAFLALPLAVLLLALLALASAASASAASKAKLGEFCTAGSGAGQCNNPTGVAVNGSGAGGVNAGDFYVADKGNNRIDEFSVAGAFVRAWGRDALFGAPA